METVALFNESSYEVWFFFKIQLLLVDMVSFSAVFPLLIQLGDH